MRKILFAATVIATMASCSQNEVENTATNNRIRFSGLNDRVTRSANDASEDYRVFAKSVSGSENAWFVNDSIDGMSDSPLSGSVYYWPGQMLEFYAWAPLTVKAADYSYGSNLAINYQVPTDAQEDFTIAEPIRSDGSTNSGNITFAFAHKLAKITSNVVLSDALIKAGYSIDLTNADFSLTVNSDNAMIVPTAAASTWTTPNTKVTTYTGQAFTAPNNNVYAPSFLIMPQTSTGCSILVENIIINKSGNEIFSGNLKVYSIQAGNVPSDKFIMGSHYNLELTIDNLSKDDNDDKIFGGVIGFRSGIANWNDVTGSAIQQP